MAVESIPRRAGPFESDGVGTGFSFSFRVFKESEVSVVVSSSAEGTAIDSSLNYLKDYTVTLNADQENNPGGKVTLLTAPARGVRVTVLSAVQATQETQLTNHDGLSPKILNTVHDKLTILIQQLQEKADRTVVVPASSTKTPDQLLTEILEVADSANDFAAEAKAILDKAKVIDANVTANANSVALMKSSVDESEQNVTNLAAQVNEYSDELTLVAENLDAIETVGTQRTAIQAIANDIQGYPVYEFDGGEIGEPNEPMNGVGGVLRVCAENIEDIRKVAASLDSTATLTELAEVVEEIGSTDYVEIDKTGNTGA